MIKVDSLTRKYGDFTAVDNVSFTISQGEIVGLLGHNGAGKTTIMKMMTGFLEPTAGTILIDGDDIGLDRQAVAGIIGYLPENCPVYSEMTVLDYLDYAASLHGVPKEQRMDLVCEAITSTDLLDKANQPIATLSRGYRQRTGVAQAILHKPKILILDEPTNGLDPTQIKHMRDLITELAKHATVIISTHILQEVQAICDRAIIIRDGQKVLDSRLDSLQKNSRLLFRTDAEPSHVIPYFTDYQNIIGVESLDVSGDNASGHCYGLSFHCDSDPDHVASAVASSIHQQQWQLFTLQFEGKDLESVFAEMSVS